MNNGIQIYQGGNEDTRPDEQVLGDFLRGDSYGDLEWLTGTNGAGGTDLDALVFDDHQAPLDVPGLTVDPEPYVADRVPDIYGAIATDTLPVGGCGPLAPGLYATDEGEYSYYPPV